MQRRLQDQESAKQQPRPHSSHIEPGIKRFSVLPAGPSSCGQLLIGRSSYTKPMDGLLPWMVGGEVGKKGESPWQVTDFYCQAENSPAAHSQGSGPGCGPTPPVILHREQMQVVSFVTKNSAAEQQVNHIQPHDTRRSKHSPSTVFFRYFKSKENYNQ